MNIANGLLLGFIALDVATNFFLIKHNVRPNHIINTIVRIVVVGFLTYDINYWTWFYHFVNTLVGAYWFLFDTFLNIARGENVAYLGKIDPRPMVQIIREETFRGKVSIIDQLQLHLLPATIWWYFKFILCFTAIGCIAINYQVYGTN